MEWDSEIMCQPFYLKISLLVRLMARGQSLMDVFVHITEELPAVWTSASERLRIGRYIFAPQNENMLVELCKISLYSGQVYCVYNNEIDICVFIDYLDKIKNEVLEPHHHLCF